MKNTECIVKIGQASEYQGAYAPSLHCYACHGVVTDLYFCLSHRVTVALVTSYSAATLC